MLDELEGKVQDTPLMAALSERYLAYALSTIMARSLPDVRDGLKPVHRRLLYAMHQLKLDPGSGFKKCARVVGDVMGKFHPHGDASIYEALVRLAQTFAARYPLIEGQGNFGNIDGDNAAAMRYTESRLTEFAASLLEGIELDTVDFRPTYDGEDAEPLVLPGAFPNLLANGATGIAVGMATSIPPHNVPELAAAALRLIEKPDADTAELLSFVKGPDFPTGGVIIEEPQSLLATYATGKGGFRLRAGWFREDLRHGTWQVVVTDIPYQVQKSKLIEQIAELLEQKKLPLLADIRDESTDQVRLVLEPRNRSVDPALLMETLFRASQLETRFSMNMNVLDANRAPVVMGLREVLRAWLDHRQTVLIRRSRHQLAAAQRRLEVVDGYLVIYLNLDKVIKIIREYDHPKVELMRAFSLSDTQVEAVLNMRLRSLRRLEEMELKQEQKALRREIADLEKLLGDVATQWRSIAREIAATSKKIASGPFGQRRTKLAVAPIVAMVSDEVLVEKEPMTVTISQKLWVRGVRSHVADPTELKFKDGDAPRYSLQCETTDRIIVFSSSGKAFTIRAADVPRGRGDGQPIRLLADLQQTDDVVAAFIFRGQMQNLVAGTAGRGFLVQSDDLLTERRTGKQILSLRECEAAIICTPAQGDHIAVIGDNRRMLVFPLDQIPVLARGTGVALQKYRDGGLRDVKIFNISDGLSWKLGERTRTETNLQEWLGARGQAGRLPPSGFPKSGRFAG
ncbi:MAG: DNA topoisomerase IV subunit A [Acidocella sp.]|nr:DNA topoisomerase IV subunit A [Acidocella sp.]